ncbi:MAG: UDP-glucose/GDP-mannose dehydrogenase family protein [Actinobacteria bacterium]|nr:UDP-glucose/GDP-mannose dehydrogenase family protein [Actinomycetota bacterium]
MRVAVVGLGKLGAPLAAVLASKGNQVMGIDVNPAAVQLLNDGRAPVEEPGLQELVSSSSDRLAATTDLGAAAGVEVSIVLVPTPSDDRGAFSNEHVLSALEEIGRGLARHTDYHLVVISSTVMPGSCDSELRPALERASGRRVGETLGLCYSPEFIALGSVIRDLREPDMVLIGESDPRAGDILELLYAGVCENDPPFRRMSLVNAELAKIAVNTYVTMKISYANALADMCERLPDADVEIVTEALGLDTRIGRKYLQGAIAYGGPCFPRDNKAFAALARDLGAEPLLAEATDAVNAAQTDRLARIVESRLQLGMTVGILGLAYKPDTGIVEESPGVALARLLGEAGYDVLVYDPVSTEAAVRALEGLARGSESVADLLERSDVTVIATPWPEFAELPLEAFEREGKRPVVIDCWRLLSEETYGETVDIVRLGRSLETSSLSVAGG